MVVVPRPSRSLFLQLLASISVASAITSSSAASSSSPTSLGKVCPGSGQPATWLHVYSLNGGDIAQRGCPGDLVRASSTSHIPGGPPVQVCVRGHAFEADGKTITTDVYQKSAFVVRGYECKVILQHTHTNPNPILARCNNNPTRPANPCFSPTRADLVLSCQLFPLAPPNHAPAKHQPNTKQPLRFQLCTTCMYHMQW